jgi:hypothetical protein
MAATSIRPTAPPNAELADIGVLSRTWSRSRPRRCRHDRKRHRYRHAARDRRSPRGERRPLAQQAHSQARKPVPRRIPHEFYPTPPEAVRALLSVETFDGPIWEPACGEGAIATELAAAGHSVVSTDRYAYGFGQSGIDFLAERIPRARHIVTNPPYGHGLADAFMIKAHALTRQTGGKAALLLNLASLCHPCRTQLWRQMPPARIYAVDDIVCWPEHPLRPRPGSLHAPSLLLGRVESGP